MPLMKLTKYWEFLEELGGIVKQEKDLEALKKELKTKIALDSSSTVNEINRWSTEEAMEKFSDLGLSECSFQTLEKIWKSNHDGAFEGYLADEILLLIVNSKETIINETLSFESRVGY